MNEPSISHELSRPDLFNLFREQLKKDFADSGADAAFARDLPTDYLDLEACIATALKKIDQHHSGLLMNLCYRIDVSENAIKQMAKTGRDRDYYHVLAEQIIKRVLQKVVLKIKFSK